MKRTIAVLGSALFFAVAPSSVAGLVPWWITHWEFRPPFFDLDATPAVGILLIVAGLPGLVDSFARFALQGLGTPAPIAPTQNLVVTGLYRYVRNPIYVALVAVILGQAVLFGDQRLLGYTPVYLHYNSGRHISTNGHELADVMEIFLRNWPHAIEQLTIVGHSMGGLVARSACDYATLADYAWPKRLDHLVFLGTPHLGA